VQLDPDQPPVPVPVDNDALGHIAQISGGQAYTAQTESQLRQVYTTLSDQIGYEVRRIDDSRPWLAGGTLLLMIGIGTGLRLGRRIP